MVLQNQKCEIMKRTVLTSVMALALSMMALSFATAAPAAESRFIVADSTHALLSGVKMEFLRINHIPVTSSYDGLIRFVFAANVQAADVMLSRWDSLRISPFLFGICVNGSIDTRLSA